jgi:hypothetical protein
MYRNYEALVTQLTIEIKILKATACLLIFKAAHVTSHI